MGRFDTKFALTLAVATLFFGGCQKAYYSTMEAFGKHKREILVDRVVEARDAQNEAKEQFSSALEQFSSVLNFQGGDLEARYEKLKAEYERSESKAGAVSSRIRAVKDVAGALFKEWEDELDEYTSSELRSKSEQKLRQTRSRYSQLIAAMERAESKIQPVLRAFRDQVLFLKHNLNAQAIASLQDELDTMEAEIAVLIREMERSINEADTFIRAMTIEEIPERQIP
jgi:ElaB/YqjD/DUF883 family membrane-anchored ribosome-binding protein